MNLKYTIAAIAFCLLATACKKKEDKATPCDTKFNCKIDGTPFITSGDFFCWPLSNNLDSLNNFSIIARNCEATGLTPRRIRIGVTNVTSTGTYPIAYADIARTGFLSDIYADEVLDGHLTISRFIPEGSKEPYTDGEIKGTFDITLLNNNGQDTVQISNGEFCMSINGIFFVGS